MPFSRPTLTGLRNQAIEDITTSGVPHLDGLLRNAVLRVLAWVQAGLSYSIYGYADWIARMGVPFTAQDEFLEAWAALVGIVRKDATPASGFAQFNGTQGVALPAGTPLTSVGAIPYQTTADGTVDATLTVTVPFVATTPGAASNSPAGTPIALATPIAGLNGSGITTQPTTGGADQETNDELRTRMLQRYREPPQGGAMADYIEWATSVPGCTRAWCLPNGYGTGSVVVYPMFDDANAAFGGFPQGTDGCATDETRGPTATGDQLTVADYIYPVQPVTALIYVASPVAHPIDVTLVTLNPNTTEMQAAIVSAIQDLLLSIGQVAGTIYPSDIYEAILTTPGIVHFTVSAPVTAVVCGAGELPVMGTLTVS